MKSLLSFFLLFENPERTNTFLCSDLPLKKEWDYLSDGDFKVATASLCNFSKDPIARDVAVCV